MQAGTYGITILVKNNDQKNKNRGKKSLSRRARVHDAQGAIAAAPHLLNFPAAVSMIVSSENPNISAAFTCLFWHCPPPYHRRFLVYISPNISDPIARSLYIILPVTRAENWKACPWMWNVHLEYGLNSSFQRTDEKRPDASTLELARWAAKKGATDLRYIPSVNDGSCVTLS